MKKLSLLLENLTNHAPFDKAIEVTHITNNSRDVVQGTLFLAYPGEKSDGRKYISQAIAQGATAIGYEPSDDFTPEKTVIPCIPIKNLKVVQSEIAARFYDFPSTKIPVIGVTGTNGKTSITHFLAQIFADSTQNSTGNRAHQQAKECGIIGTMGYGFLPHLKKTANTTPDGLQLQTIFAELVQADAKIIAMEVSSHALANQRVNNVQFHTGIFTNLTQDHLDFHRTMDHYRDVKELLFQQPYLKNAVINIDDEAGKFFTQKYKNKLHVMTYAQHNKTADITVQKCVPTECGFDLDVKTPWGSGEFHLPLIGEFNIANALATASVLGILKMPFVEILKKLSQLKTVSGRMQLFHDENMPTVIVDYAHTPDALEKALQSARTHCSGQLWCVFGCGGDRDKTKRSIMGKIAEKNSDHVIITNDNPRSESPQAIAEDILNGVNNKKQFSVELDREKAIKKVIQSARKNDWILVAGKGHETEQIIGDKILHYNDSEVVQVQLESLKLA